MEPFIVDFIYNKKLPKLFRDLVIIVLCGLIVLIGLQCTKDNVFLPIRIFGYALAAAFVLCCIRILYKIHTEDRQDS